MRRVIKSTGIFLGLTSLYFVAGKLGLSLAFVHVSATAIWPPTGIAIAAVLLFGARVWPAIFLGAFLINFTTAGSLATSVGIATGNTLEAVVSGWLVGRLARGKRVLERPSDIARFVVLAAFGTMVSATIGVTSLAADGYARWSDYRAIWLTWWLGDFLSALTITPLLLAWATTSLRRASLRRLSEIILLGVALLVDGQVVFRSRGLGLRHLPIAFLMLPVLGWASFRFDQRGAASANCVLAVIAVIGTLHGWGPFALEDPNESLLLLQAFLATVNVTMLTLAAVVNQLRETGELLDADQQRLRLALEAGRMGTWEWTIATGRMVWSSTLEAMHGMEAGSFGGSYHAPTLRTSIRTIGSGSSGRSPSRWTDARISASNTGL